MGLNKLKI